MARPSKRSLSRGAAKMTAARKQVKPAPLPETVSSWADFYRVVRRIPHGRVCTYGAVAAMASHPRSARHVGFALAALKETGKNADVPWQRVLGGKGATRAIITIKDPVGGALQRMLLEAEGVEFDERGVVSLERFGWFQGEKKGAKKTGQKTKPSQKKRLSF
jgi:methylated-DNA-protein-cysteine methyltransferase related protein